MATEYDFWKEKFCFGCISRIVLGKARVKKIVCDAKISKKGFEMQPITFFCKKNLLSLIYHPAHTVYYPPLSSLSFYVSDCIKNFVYKKGRSFWDRPHAVDRRQIDHSIPRI